MHDGQVRIGSVGWLAGALLVAACSRPAPHAAASEKRLVQYGWNTRDTAYIREHWREMEEMPFDGIGIHVAIDRGGVTNGDGSTYNLLGWQLFAPRAFQLADFREAVADLHAPQWERFRTNFMVAAIATRDQDQGLNWFDDARWATIAGNWKLLATLAREGRCQGILLDPEHYDYETELFSYRDHRLREDRSLEEYREVARRRGRELMEAAREVFPGIEIASLYGYTLAQREPERYALLPAFFDGMLEAAGPDSVFVDLYEFSTGFKSSREFEAGYRAVREKAVAASEFPDLYRRNVRAGFGIAIDYGEKWSGGDNHFSPEELRVALEAALSRSDRYVWLYAEDGPEFFPPADLPDEYRAAIEAARTAGRQP